MHLTRWTIALSLLAGACGAPKPAVVAPSEPAKPSEPAPDARAAEPKVDVAALLAREVDPQPTHALAAPNGALKLSVEAAEAPKLTQGEGYAQLEARFGPGQLICIFYPEAKDAGEILRLMNQQTLEKVATNYQWVDVHGDQINGWGYLMARAHYLVEEEQGKVLGDYKIAVSVRDETTAVCVLDYAGYYASFERGLRTILGSLDTAENRGLERPAEEEIVRARIPARMVSIERIWKLKDGKDTLRRTISTRAQIGGDGVLETADEASSERFSKGVLQGGAYGSASLGQTAYSLELKLDAKRYSVTGEAQGKPVKLEFPAEGGLPDPDQVNPNLCLVRDGKKPRFELRHYSPSVDPLKVTTTVVEKSPATDADVIGKRAGDEGTQMAIRLDEACAMERGSVAVGPVTVELERIHHVKNKL